MVNYSINYNKRSETEPVVVCKILETETVQQHIMCVSVDKQKEVPLTTFGRSQIYHLTKVRLSSMQVKALKAHRMTLSCQAS